MHLNIAMLFICSRCEVSAVRSGSRYDGLLRGGAGQRIMGEGESVSVVLQIAPHIGSFPLPQLAAQLQAPQICLLDLLPRNVGSLEHGLALRLLFDPSGSPSPQPTGGGPGDLFNGLKPDWGPFAKVGASARTIIQVIMAAVLLICLGTALLGAAKIRLGQSEFSQDPIAVKDGRRLVIGGALGVFLVASMGGLFTIVYGMGIPNG